MKLSFLLLGLLTILGTQVMCSHEKSRPGDVITMSSSDPTNPVDQTDLHRVKRKITKSIKKLLVSPTKKRVSSGIKAHRPSTRRPLGTKAYRPTTRRSSGTKTRRPSLVTWPPRTIAQTITKANQHVKDFVTKLQIPRNHPSGKKFVTKFVDKIREAARGSASARQHLTSSLSTLLEMGNQGANLAASITQILAMTKPPQTGTVVVSQPQSDDLTPLLLTLIKPDKSGSSGVQSSVLVSAFTVCICRLLSQA